MTHLHIPDGVLPLWLVGAGWLATILAVGLASSGTDQQATRRRVPLLGVVSALMLVAMSSEIVPIGYHINLTVVAGVLLGPQLSIIAAFVVVSVLALLGHGGVTVIGLNTVLIATEMVLGWALVHVAMAVIGRKRAGLAAAIATVLTLATTTTLLVGLIALSGTGAVTDAGTLSVRRFAAFVFVFGPIGWLIEAFVTGTIIRFVMRVRPGLVSGGVEDLPHRPIPGDTEVH